MFIIYYPGYIQVLQRGKKAEISKIQPTKGAEKPVKIRNYAIVDVAGSEFGTNLWLHYLTDADALIYMLDGSRDENTIKKQLEHLKRLLEESESAGKPVLIISNKSDLRESSYCDAAKCAELASLPVIGFCIKAIFMIC